jgi:hypothetical protein
MGQHRAAWASMGEGMGQHKAALGRRIGLHRIPFHHMHSPLPSSRNSSQSSRLPPPPPPTNKKKTPRPTNPQPHKKTNNGVKTPGPVGT